MPSQPGVDRMSLKQRPDNLPRVDRDQLPLGQPDQDVVAQLGVVDVRDQNSRRPAPVFTGLILIACPGKRNAQSER